MPDSADFTAHAGVALFPRSRADLTSTTQCPACLRVLSRVPCANCGLDLAHPLATELATVSADAAQLLDARVRLIGHIRLDTENAARTAGPTPITSPTPITRPPSAPVTVAAPPAPAAPASQLPPPAVDPAPPVPTGAPPVGPAAHNPREPAAPRRSSVQVVLLIVGVSLVAVAAIFFLVYAFINFGLIWRTAIIGAVTIAAFATATLLRRRSLTSTAEGIGALAVVLVYLDAYAVRANDLFATAGSDALAYWGAALLVSAAGFLAWHRLSGLRVASIAAFTTVTPGAGLLVAGLAAPLDDSVAVFLGFLAVALAGLVHPLATRLVAAAREPAEPAPLERTVAVTLAGAGLGVAFLSAFAVTPDSEWGAPLALVAVAAVGAAQAVVAVRAARSTALLRFFGVGFAALTSVSAGAAAMMASYRVLTFDGGMIASVASTTILALVASYIVLHAPVHATGAIEPARDAAPGPTNTEPTAPTAPPAVPRPSLALRIAALVALGVAVVALVVPVALASLVTIMVSASSTLLRPWRLSVVDPIDADLPLVVDLLPAVVAIAAAIALAGAFVLLTNQLALFRPGLRWAVVALAVLAVPLLSVQWAVLAGWLVLAAAGVAVLVRHRDLAGAPRAPWAALAAASGSLGYTVAWASMDTWLAGTAATIVLLIVARSAFRVGSGVIVRAGALGVATVLAYVGAVALAWQLDVGADRLGEVFSDGPHFGDTFLDSLRFVSILSIAFMALSAVPFARVLTALDRSTVFLLAAVATAITVPSAAAVIALAAPGSDVAPTLAEPATSIVLGIVLLGALLAWLVPRANAAETVQRVTAATALAGATTWLLDSLAIAARLSDDTRLLAPTVAALLVAAACLIAVVRRGSFPRGAADLGIAVVATAGVLVAVVGSSGLGWLALLLAAVTVLLTAISADGLVGSTSRRKHLGWLALALATGALWWRLADASVDAVEAYSLPLAGALLVVALLVWSAERRQPGGTGATRAVAPMLVLVGGLVAIVPSALATTSALTVPVEGGGRAILVGSISAVLLVLGSLVRGRAQLRPYLDAAALTGFLGALIVACGRGIAHTAAGFGAARQDDARLDAWLAATAVVLAVAAAGQGSKRAGDSAWTARAAQGLLVVAIAVVLLFETVAFSSADLGTARAITLPLVFAGLYVAGAVVDRMPLTALVARAALAAAVVAACVGLASGAVDDVETVAVPIAIALLITGVRRLASTPGARSWPTLGAGLAVLLLPSLVATLDDRPVWRLVAIGVVAIAALVVGLRLGLQAPFILGAVVALVHGIATFAPQIRAVYELTELWVWAGLGGILIIVLAARYERSLGTAKRVVRGIAGLR
jgi:hypothetical protein